MPADDFVFYTGKSKNKKNHYWQGKQYKNFDKNEMNFNENDGIVLLAGGPGNAGTAFLHYMPKNLYNLPLPLYIPNHRGTVLSNNLECPLQVIITILAQNGKQKKK